MDNPYSVPKCAESPARYMATPGNRPLPITTSLLYLLTLTAGTALLFVELEWVSVTGVLLSGLGSVLVYQTWKTPYRLLLILGGSGPFIAFTCLTVIAGYEISPAQADLPLKVLGVSYLTCGWILLLTESRLQQSRRQRSPTSSR